MLELRSILGYFLRMDDDGTGVSFGKDNVIVDSVERSCFQRLDDVDQEVNKPMDEQTFENWTLEEQEVDWWYWDDVDDDDEENDEYLEIYDNLLVVEDNSLDCYR